MSDLIERKDVVAMIAVVCKTRDRCDQLPAIRKGLKNIPSVDVVVHGHWIYKKSGWAECSECHHDFIGVYDLENSDNYCRHCGAKMDEEAKA